MLQVRIILYLRCSVFKMISIYIIDHAQLLPIIISQLVYSKKDSEKIEKIKLESI